MNNRMMPLKQISCKTNGAIVIRWHRMRCYDTRHTVAALRKIIGLNQGELAVMVGRSKRTIQAVEIGRLKISEDLAARIAHETGVSMHWLLRR